MTTLSERLQATGLPLLHEQLVHPTVVGIARGDLPESTFRSWLEQDYLFLLDYVRVLARLAWQAPRPHLGALVDLAHSTWHDELDLHRSLAAESGADLEHARKGPACSAYTEFLLEAAAEYATGLAALLPCLWGYSSLGRMLPRPTEPRYARWVDTYADPRFAALAERCARMLDEATPSDDPTFPTRAEEAFLSSMCYELAFWDVP